MEEINRRCVSVTIEILLFLISFGGIKKLCILRKIKDQRVKTE